MLRRLSASLLTATLALCLVAPASADGRETEMMRTFITSFRSFLAREVLRRIPADRAGVRRAFTSWETASILSHERRGPMLPSRWELKQEIEDALEADLETIHPHVHLTPELELFETRLREVLHLTKGDALKPEQEHFEVLHHELRVRFRSLSHLADMVAVSLDLDPKDRSGTGDGGQAPLDFGGLEN